MFGLTESELLSLFIFASCMATINPNHVPILTVSTYTAPVVLYVALARYAAILRLHRKFNEKSFCIDATFGFCSLC